LFEAISYVRLLFHHTTGGLSSPYSLIADRA